MTAAAMLDPAIGAIVGFAAPIGAKAAKVRFEVDGATVLTLMALGPAEALSETAWSRLGPPPSANCAFASRIPGGVGPGRLRVLGDDGQALLDHNFTDARAYARYEEGRSMAESLTLTISRLRAGVFSGRLEDPAAGPAPIVELRIRGEIVGPSTLTSVENGAYDFSANLPEAAIGDGVSTVEFVTQSGAVLASYPFCAGEPLAGDLAAEVASLRAELDQLKAAFRETLAGGVVSKDERPMMIAEVLTHVDGLLDLRDRAHRAEVIDSDEEDDVWEGVD